MHNTTNELSVIMATQFVKWWKTKFHVGACSYKSISVLGSNVCDGRPSDTEELVRDDTSSAYNNGAHINPGLVSSTVSEVSHPPEATEYLHQHSHEVKFEDFECDVQVEGCATGEEKKEFSFTFYDFDGHGKITKDDIAGLVRSIYGAVNDSITVPQGGKKTIKVRLTVTPEKTQASGIGETTTSNNCSSPTPCPVSSSPPNNNINNSPNNNNNITVVGMGNITSNLDSRPTLRNNVNVTIKENLNRDRLGGSSGRKEKELRERLSHLDKPKFNSVRLPNSSCRGCRNLSPEVFRDCSASPLRNRKKWRERVCSLQRPDILEILQANMEKNNVNPCCRRDHTQQNAPHHTQHSMAPCTHSQLITDATCPVLPLLNENLCKQKLIDSSFPSSSAFRHPHHYLGVGGKVYDAHIHRSSHQHSHQHQHQHQCRKHGHHRSRSHDLSQNIFRHHSMTERDHILSQAAPLGSAGGANQTCCSNLNSNNLFLEQQPQDSLKILEGCFINQQNQQFSPRNKNTNLANAASTPHQLKHRNREQEHARAMAQVISWLERENIGGCDKKFSSPRKNPNPSTNSLLGSPPAVKKHEHHHVHEHIHHHYHHHFAKETPIIV